MLSRFGRTVVGAWLAAGVVGVNLGGSYWPHYYMQPLAPLALLAGVGAAALTVRVLRVATATAVALPTVVWLAALATTSAHDRQATIPYYRLSLENERIGEAVEARTTTHQRIYVLESAASIYLFAERRASYPYLWGMPIQKIPTAVPLLRSMLGGFNRPTLVIMETDPTSVDPTGGIANDLATYYHPDGVVDGVQILRAN